MKDSESRRMLRDLAEYIFINKDKIAKKDLEILEKAREILYNTREYHNKH